MPVVAGEEGFEPPNGSSRGYCLTTWRLPNSAEILPQTQACAIVSVLFPLTLMHRVVHFEIQVENPERAIAFYTSVFDWTFQKWEGGASDYWMIMTADKESKELGINGGLLRRPCKTPEVGCGTNAFVCTIVTDDFDESGKKILAAGGIVALPKFAIPGMAWQGYYLDTEGNTFGLHQADTNAK